LSLLKPGVDAWRAAIFDGSNRKQGTTVDPKSEITMTRFLELCFESIPGTVIQLAVLLSAKEVDSVANLALASSIITVGSM